MNSIVHNGDNERIGLTFSDPEIRRCPFRAYDSLRDQQPVYRDPITGNYILTRYDDVRKVLLKPKIFKSDYGHVDKLE